METWTVLGSGNSVFGLLLVTALRATIILALADLAAYTLRRRSAAAVHLVWALAVAAVLALPLLSGSLPRIDLPLAVARPSNGNPRLASWILNNPDRVQEGSLQVSNPSAASPSSSAMEEPDASPLQRLPWARLLILLWAGGVCVTLAPGLVGLTALRNRARTAYSSEGTEWARLLDDASRRVGVPHFVQLLFGKHEEIPMTWGVFRRSILMPASAAAWPEERKRAVLEHELAHVKRGDFIVQLGSTLLCSLHWFNPLAWWAAAALRNSAERACDDLVLNAGSKPSEYAGHLLAVCRALRRPPLPAFLGIPLARSTRLERRIRRVLDPDCDRRSTPPRACAVMCAAALLCAGLIAAFHPTARAEDSGPLLILQPELDKLDEGIKKEWLSQGISSDDQLRTKLQDVTAECIKERLKKAGIADATVQKKPEGQVEVMRFKQEDLPRVKDLVFKRGILSFYEVASIDEALQALKAIDENPKFQKRLLPLIDAGTNHREVLLVKTKDYDNAKAIVDEIDSSPGVLAQGKTFALARDRFDESDTGYRLYLLNTQSPMSSVRVALAKVEPRQPDQIGARIVFKLSAADGERFADLTQSLIGKALAIVVDGDVLCAPVVRDRIEGGNGVISGNFTLQEAQDLATRLTSKSLPAPLVDAQPGAAWVTGTGTYHETVVDR